MASLPTRTHTPRARRPLRASGHWWALLGWDAVRGGHGRVAWQGRCGVVVSFCVGVFRFPPPVNFHSPFTPPPPVCPTRRGFPQWQRRAGVDVSVARQRAPPPCLPTGLLGKGDGVDHTAPHAALLWTGSRVRGCMCFGRTFACSCVPSVGQQALCGCVCACVFKGVCAHLCCTRVCVWRPAFPAHSGLPHCERHRVQHLSGGDPGCAGCAGQVGACSGGTCVCPCVCMRVRAERVRN
jgi:hypothetical protein